jgi:O-antigen/teichoic acid export membrane protein
VSATRAKQTFFNFLTIGANAVSSLVVTAVIARWLAPSGMGTYSLVTWFFTIAGIMVNLGLVTTTMKYVAEALGRDDRPQAGGILAYGLKQLLFNGAVVSAAWIALTPWVASVYGKGGDLQGLMWVATAAIIPASVMALLTAACQGVQRYGQVAFATGVYASLMLLGTITVLATGLGIPGLLGVMAIAATTTSGLYLYFLHQWQPGWYKHGVDDERRGALRRYSGSLMILILLDAIVWQRSGVFFLGLWSPAQEVGFYALAFGLATMAMKMVPGTLIGLLIPSMSRSFGSGDLPAVSRMYQTAGRWMAILALPVAVGGTVLAPQIVTLMYGAAYLPMAPVLGVLFFSGALVMIFGFPASSVLYAVEGQQHLVRIGFAVGVLNLLLAVLLIPRFGAMGAAWSTSVAQAASLIPGAYFAGKMLGGTRPATRTLPATFAAALAMGVPVWAIAQVTAPGLALAIGIPLGAVCYALNLWCFRALAPEDTERVMSVASRIPVVKGLLPARV